MDITIVVRGYPIRVSFDEHVTIEDAMLHALKSSGNLDMLLSGWEMRNEDGVPLFLSDNLKNAHIKDGSYVYLNLKACIGG